MKKDHENLQAEIKEAEEKLKLLKLEQNKDSSPKNQYIIPGAIIIAGLLIAGAVFFSRTGPPGTSLTAGGVATAGQSAPDPSGQTDNVRPVSSDDHIRGNPDAPVKIVEYSDFECPFCKRFHSTMQQVMDEYGEDEQVAWIYRQFPLDQLHSKARGEAVASECAADIGGNDAFWEFTDRFFELTPSNNQTNIDTILPQIAREIGIDQDLFQACLEGNKFDRHVQDDVENATATGGGGTPWSVVIAPNEATFPLSGAQPYESVKALIDAALKEN